MRLGDIQALNIGIPSFKNQATRADNHRAGEAIFGIAHSTDSRNCAIGAEDRGPARDRGQQRRLRNNERPQASSWEAYPSKREFPTIRYDATPLRRSSPSRSACVSSASPKSSSNPANAWRAISSTPTLSDRYVDQPPEIGLAPARRNAWRAVRFKEKLLEVGVNAGHSALLALSSNPRLEYYGVDIMSHAYTAECVDFLKGEFPGRVHLFTGDSREVLPWLVSRRAELAFDIFHVDGGHTDEVCRSDMGNCIRSPAASAGGMFCSTTSMRAGSSTSIANSYRAAI